MKWRVVVSLLLAAGVNLALAELKPRNWQPGKVTQVERPGKGRQPGWGTIEPHIVSRDMVVMLTSTSFGVRWAVAIALPDAVYAVALPPPPRKSSLAKLEAGAKLECAVEGRSMYLKDDKGTVFRAGIKARIAP